MHKTRGVLGKHQKKNALGYALGFVGPHKFLPFTDTTMPIFYLVKTKMRMAIRVAKPYYLCYNSRGCIINNDFRLYDTGCYVKFLYVEILELTVTSQMYSEECLATLENEASFVAEYSLDPFYGSH